MASRALTAMLIIAVSNWPASALMKHGCVGPLGHDLDPRADQRADHFAEHLDALADVEQFRIQRLAPCERQQLACQSGSARHRVRDRVDVAQPPRLRQIRPPQQIDGGADHREQIVEVMRDAAGELPQRLQPLAMFQRFLRLEPLVGFGIEMPRPPQCRCEQDKQQRGGGSAENQMLAHGGEPARAYRRCLQAGADVNRIFGEPLITEPAFDAVGRRLQGHEAGSGVRRDLLSDRSIAVEPELVIDAREAGQHRAVGQAERKEAARLAADPGIEILEIFRQHRSLNHTGETTVLVRAAAADAEERRALIGRPRLQRIADVSPDIARRCGP